MNRDYAREQVPKTLTLRPSIFRRNVPLWCSRPFGLNGLPSVATDFGLARERFSSRLGVQQCGYAEHKAGQLVSVHFLGGDQPRARVMQVRTKISSRFRGRASNVIKRVKLRFSRLRESLSAQLNDNSFAYVDLYSERTAMLKHRQVRSCVGPLQQELSIQLRLDFR